MENFNELKLILQQYGALQPLAWEKIISLKQVVPLKPQESFIRKQGSLVYLANGLLKEYDAQHRSWPAIINFIGTGKFIITRRYNQHYYLKACVPSLLFSWEYDSLQLLYQEFNELKTIYNELCDSYDAQILLRMRMLEMPVQQRILAFKLAFQATLPYLKKKDIANYLHIGYTNLLSKF